MEEAQVTRGSQPSAPVHQFMDCPFRFVVQWNVAKNSLQVKRGNFVHNHLVSARALSFVSWSRQRHGECSGGRDDGRRREAIAHLRLTTGARSERAPS
jgi:hypothetical protein